MKYCNKLRRPPLCNIVINWEDTRPLITYYVIYGQALILTAIAIFARVTYCRAYYGHNSLTDIYCAQQKRITCPPV